MTYNQAVNVMGVAYHYFTIKPGLFEAWALLFIRDRFYLCQKEKALHVNY